MSDSLEKRLKWLIQCNKHHRAILWFNIYKKRVLSEIQKDPKRAKWLRFKLSFYEKQIKAIEPEGK
jgi:aminoglycoside phosphotransferase (APT) family kinase protein